MLLSGVGTVFRAQAGKSRETPRVSGQVAWLHAGHPSNLLIFTHQYVNNKTSKQFSGSA